MKTLSLFVDIDNTVSDHMDRLRRINQSNLLPIEEFAHLPEWVKSDKPLEGACEYIKKLSQDFIIVWLTARKSSLREVTKNWLEENNFCMDELILVDTLDDKISVLLKNQPSIFIDDLQYDFFSLEPKKATIAIDKLNKLHIPFIRYEGNWKHTYDSVIHLAKNLI